MIGGSASYGARDRATVIGARNVAVRLRDRERYAGQEGPRDRDPTHVPSSLIDVSTGHALSCDIEFDILYVRFNFQILLVIRSYNFRNVLIVRESKDARFKTISRRVRGAHSRHLKISPQGILKDTRNFY